MSLPLWNSGEKVEEKRFQKLEARKRRARFVVEYDLVYDGGSSRWKGYYRTYLGARAAAFWNLKISSWGGDAALFPYPKPTPPRTVGPKSTAGNSGARKKGIFHGR